MSASRGLFCDVLCFVGHLLKLLRWLFYEEAGWLVGLVFGLVLFIFGFLGFCFGLLWYLVWFSFWFGSVFGLVWLVGFVGLFG